eukprot:6775526-Pyramimonas_sp.AAC.1
MATGVKDDRLEDKSWHPIMGSFDKLAGPINDQEWGAILVFLVAALNTHATNWGWRSLEGHS